MEYRPFGRDRTLGVGARIRLRQRRRAHGARHAGRAGARGGARDGARHQLLRHRRRSTATASPSSNLGQVLKTLKATVYVGTKFRLERDGPRPACRRRSSRVARREPRSASASSGSICFQLHNLISAARERGTVASTATCWSEVVPALSGPAAPGQDPLLRHHRARRHAGAPPVIDAGVLDTAQVCFNLLNPSAGMPLPGGLSRRRTSAGFSTDARRPGMGTIGIRVLAARRA